MTEPSAPDPESLRLAEDRARKKNWKRWGPYLSERQWGTVREDYSAGRRRPGTTSPTTRARSRAYRWGEDGIAGISDRHATHLLRARPVEREGPDPQGAPLRPHRPGGKPRRGRQGVLLLSRLHADALVHADALQVPAGGVPVREAARGERAARQAGARVRAPRHGRLRRRTATSTSSSTYAKASPEDILVDDRGRQPRSRGRAAPRPADALVPQHVVVGPRRAEAARSQRPKRRAGAAARSRSRTRLRRPARSTPKARRSSSSPRTTRTTARLCGSRERRAVREGRVPRARRPRRRGRREPRRARHEGRRVVPVRRARRADRRRSGCA